MKKARVIFRHIFELALASVLLTGCQAIDTTFGSFAYFGFGLITFVIVSIAFVNFTPRKIVLRKFRSVVEKG